MLAWRRALRRIAGGEVCETVAVKADRRTSIMKNGVQRVVLVVGVVLASACSGSPASAPDDADAVIEAPSADSGFALDGDIIGGGAFSIDDALAVRPIALWFWAPG